MAANQNYALLNSSKTTPMWAMGQQALLDEGSLFVATNPTVGTAVATTTSVVDAGNSGATSAQTRPVAILYNANGDGSDKMVYPISWNMRIAQVPTSATSWQMALWLEPVGASAYTSGGSQITPVALNQWSANVATNCSVYFGAITAAATTSGGKLVAIRQINSAVPVTLDQWFITFGMVRGSDLISGGAGAKNVNIALPAIGIPPGWAMKLGMWGASNAAAPSWEFELVYAERGIGQ